MVAEHFEDGEGELMRRVRAVVGDRIPLVASLDYHTNMTPEMVRQATAMVGYRTYPHIDMADTGGRAARLLDRLLKDRRTLHKAYRQLDFLIPLVWQCTLMEPAKGIFELIAEIERGSDRAGGPTGSHNQGIVSITHTPGFPPADIAQCGPALVVYGHDKDAAEAQADRLAAFIKEREVGPMTRCRQLHLPLFCPSRSGECFCRYFNRSVLKWNRGHLAGRSITDFDVNQHPLFCVLQTTET